MLQGNASNSLASFSAYRMPCRSKSFHPVRVPSLQMAAANAKAKINLPCTSSTTFSALSPGSMLAFNVSGLYAFSLMSQISTYFASILPAQPCCSTYQLLLKISVPGSKAAFNVRHRISTSRSFLALTKPIKLVPTAESSIQHHLCRNG